MDQGTAEGDRASEPEYPGVRGGRIGEDRGAGGTDHSDFDRQGQSGGCGPSPDCDIYGGSGGRNEGANPGSH